jgi:hypothetical protein
MNPDPIYSRALLLAEEFLATARVEVMQLADDDLDQLRASAAALRSAAAERSSAAKGAEHIAYVVVASAFNQALAARERESAR